MATTCLPKAERDKLLKAFRSQDISIPKLYEMDSAKRLATFQKYTGKDLGSFVNAKFEQAMVSNQKKAMRDWIEKITTPKDKVKGDLIKKVGKIEKFLSPSEEFGFLEDLARTKLGIGVTEEEAQILLKIKGTIDDLRTKIPENSPVRGVERLAYGYAVDDFKQYVGALKREAREIPFLERLKSENYGRNLYDIAGITKSLAATFDDSFLGRQGLRVLYNGNYQLWVDTAVSSLENFGKELFEANPGFFKDRPDNVMRAIRADIYSRPNALNGKYNAAANGYGLGVLTEEAFPTSLPERIPLLGRVFKASETAFNGSALRMRADLADAEIAALEKNGIDMLDPREATAHAKRITSMTGRGEIGKLGAIGEELNVAVFSIKNFKSLWDTLTAHQFDRTMTPSARKKSAESLMRIAAHIGTILMVAKILNPDSVEFDPRKGRLGKIRFGTRDISIDAGLGGLVVFASRIVPTLHNGEWGSWRYSERTGKWTNMWEPKFGQTTALDYLENYFEGKLSPLAGAVRDVMRGQNFEGEKPTFVNTTIGLIVPITAEMIIDELRKGNDDILVAILAETFGFSPVSVLTGGYGKKWQELKDKVDPKTYNDAQKEVTRRFNERARKLENSSRWKRMDNDERSKEMDKIRTEETDRVLSKYGI